VSTSNSAKVGARSRETRTDVAFVARRVVVIIAASAGLFGILADQPVVSVAWRAAVVALLGVTAIHLAERAVARSRPTTARSTRGGTR